LSIFVLGSEKSRTATFFMSENEYLTKKLSFNRFSIEYQETEEYIKFDCSICQEDYFQICLNRLKNGSPIEEERALIGKYIYDVFSSVNSLNSEFRIQFFFNEKMFIEYFKTTKYKLLPFGENKWWNCFSVKISAQVEPTKIISTLTNLGQKFDSSNIELGKFYYTAGSHKTELGYCSDNRCPCSQDVIPNGRGYWYVVENSDKSYSFNLTCEKGARLRNLDLQVARKDARIWWAFGLTPLRKTPEYKGDQIAPLGASLSEKQQESFRKEMKDFTLKLLSTDIKYIFFDTETTGLPKDWKAPVDDLNNWPRLVQLGYVIYDSNDKFVESGDYIIKPDGFEIPEESAKVHGISTERAYAEGVDLSEILTQFSRKVEKCEYLVAHNMNFDEKIIGSELLRNNFPNVVQEKEKICTMLATVNYCKIPGRYDNYKWPKLSELHVKLFGEDFENAHNAFADIEATAKCFFELKRRNIIKI